VQNDDVDEKKLTRARNAAYRYLTHRPRSQAEVERKLRDKEFEPEVIRVVLDDLTRLGYINDEHFAAQWASARVRLRGFGRRRIEQELRTKGINRDIIRETLDSIFEESSEADVARREAEKKLKSLIHFDAEVRRRRLAGFLERKGFSSHTISTILRTLK
jgi:regulatory protein